jgi:hypothetical protein
MFVACFGCVLELSLTVPIVNAMAFLFTVLGEWLVEGKVISRGTCHALPTRIGVRSRSIFSQSADIRAEETGIGMVLSLAGIALCVQSKN